MVTLSVTGRWQNVLHGEAKASLEALLPDVLQTKRWFGGKAGALRAVRIVEAVPIPYGCEAAQLLFIRVEFLDGASDTYIVPLAFAVGDQAIQIRDELSHTVIAPLRVDRNGSLNEGLLYDALWNRDFTRTLLRAIGEQRRYPGGAGELAASPTTRYGDLVEKNADVQISVSGGEQSNTSVIFGDQVILKLYRRLGEGVSPDLELGRGLTSIHFPHVPPVAGAIEYCSNQHEPVTLGILHRFVRNEGDAWQQALQAVEDFFAKVVALHPDPPEGAVWSTPLTDSVQEEAPQPVRALLGSYAESVRILGRRTAELHLTLLTLAQGHQDQNFLPETFTRAYQQARYDSMCRLVESNFDLLRHRVATLSEPAQKEAQRLLDLQPAVIGRFRAFLDLTPTGLRTRCHGDYHLGQVLCTGRDFMIIDFEGEPARPLSERRMKHSPLVDVAGMLRSFHYAPYAALLARSTRQQGQATQSFAVLEPWARVWYRWVTAAFLQAYIPVVSGAAFWPRSGHEVQVLLDTHLLEKAVYELGYELNNRPDWVRIPLQGIQQLVEDASGDPREVLPG